jgi:phospholipid/cholesterol/gamma-HCH transport system substrate-binding protein
MSAPGRPAGGVWAALAKFATLAVVVALATTVLGLTIANAQPGDTTSYTARFTDATGLLPGDDVRIAGVVVGVVDEVQVVDRRIAEVTFSVQDSQRLPASAGAAIYYKNLIGQRYLALLQGAGPPGATLAPGGTIPVERTRGPLNLTILFNGFKPLFVALDAEQVNQLSFEIIQVLQGQGGTVRSLLASTASLTNTIADRDRVIGELIENLNAVLDTVNARDEELSGLVIAMQELVSGLAADREPIGEAIVSIGELTEVTAGFLDEVRPPLRDDIVLLGDLAENLDENEATVERFLRRWPGKLNTISRAASYGSWFQFYLCGGSGVVGLGETLPPFRIETYTNPAERCGPDPDGDGRLVGDDARVPPGEASPGEASPGAKPPGAKPPGGKPPVPPVERADHPALPDLPLVGG